MSFVTSVTSLLMKRATLDDVCEQVEAEDYFMLLRYPPALSTSLFLFSPFFSFLLVMYFLYCCMMTELLRKST